MVASPCSATRSQLARDSGLGQSAASNQAKAVRTDKPRAMEMVESVVDSPEVVGAEDGPKKGRPRQVA